MIKKRKPKNIPPLPAMRTEVVNELIREKLIKAEQSGFSNLTCDEILAKARETAASR